MSTRSGKSWVAWAELHARNSTRLEDLDPAFRVNLASFIQALQAAGARVDVWATRRSRERAYLFHWSWKIALGLCKAADAVQRSGVEIEWDHGDEHASRQAALEMVVGFGLAVPPQSLLPPLLDSEHLAGNAVDMDILWSGTLAVKDGQGRSVELCFMSDSNANEALHSVGASYGVLKLKDDAPHWSATGR